MTTAEQTVKSKVNKSRLLMLCQISVSMSVSH